MTLDLFYFLAFVSIFCALMVIFAKNPIHSVLYLVLTFFAIAGQYILLNAQFLAAVHIIVYAGAIMVLFLFVIMLLNLNKETEPHKNTWIKLAAVISGGALMVVLVATLKGAETIAPVAHFNADIGLVKNLGQVLFHQFLLPFEVSSILFLAAMVGAVMLGKKEIH
ncbi:MAG TPA: NADH-quinone oxidoreductase subunit J [Bacteroidia bacterium]|nr:NADH-quinone oxidoreductase subunit J [Bacteroidia bacterium]